YVMAGLHSSHRYRQVPENLSTFTNLSIEKRKLSLPHTKNPYQHPTPFSKPVAKLHGEYAVITWIVSANKPNLAQKIRGEVESYACRPCEIESFIYFQFWNIFACPP